jgi:hypothetical protein
MRKTNGGYSGNSIFNYIVERYKNNAGESFKDSDIDYSKYSDEEFDSIFKLTKIDLTVEGSSYFKPGQFYGSPENCHPDDGELEIISITDCDGNDWKDKLTPLEKEEIEEIIVENAQDER